MTKKRKKFSIAPGVDSDDDWAVFLTPKNINLFNNFKRRKVACSTRGAWCGSGVGDGCGGKGSDAASGCVCI